MTKNIHHQFFFPHSPEVVWEYLTRAELMEQWLMKNDFQPIVGHQFQFMSSPAPAIDFDGIVYCTVVEIVPHKKLSYSWKCGPGNGKITIDSIVEWTLRSKNNGTELQLNHDGFKVMENAAIFLAMDEGWLRHITLIAECINTAQHGTTNS
jgi:uncharacterized protein YndB with AHSA1/START domain